MTHETDAARHLYRMAGAHRCLHDWDPHTHHHCGQPAAVHVLCLDGYCTMVCQSHAQLWYGKRIRDFHHIGGDCGLPDTSWMVSTPGEPGRCLIEGLDLPDLFATDAELRGDTR